MSGDAADWCCPSCGASFAQPIELCPKDGTRLIKIAEPSDPNLGRILAGRFTLRARIGKGGMGTVYRAFQHSLGREVALKLIRPDFATDPQAARRFLREAQLVSRLVHPHVVSTLDFGQGEDGELFLVMELLSGTTLRERMTEEGRMPMSRVVAIAVQLCDALEAAHGQGIIHRDLKPSNVVVLDQPSDRDFIKVLDFGLAKSLEAVDSTMTNSGEVMGTPRYIAPEVALGQGASVASDLYALGVILYEMASGRAPFDPASKRSTLRQTVEQNPAPLGPEIPTALQNVILRLLEKEPARRYRSAASTREALRAAEESSGRREVAVRSPALPLPGVLDRPSAELAAGSGATEPGVKRPSWLPMAAAVILASGLTAGGLLWLGAGTRGGEDGSLPATDAAVAAPLDASVSHAAATSSRAAPPPPPPPPPDAGRRKRRRDATPAVDSPPF
jgi:serine/threonine-protein kinase